MHKPYNVYYNLGYWFLLYIVLVFAGFYSSYFTIFFEPKKPIIHTHFALMSLWIILLIIQPFLIKFKRLRLHRLLGKGSYFLFPLVALSGYQMIRFSYYNILFDHDTQVKLALQDLNAEQLNAFAASFQAIAIFYLSLFILFYSLAIIYRKKSNIHARFILASALTLLGPTVDRIIFFGFGMQMLPGSLPIELVAFAIADLVLALLLFKDYRNRRPTRALAISLSIYVIGQALYFTLPQTAAWSSFVGMIL
jgi:DMSO reductase anchor subunit